MRFLVGIIVLAGGVLLGLYGLFALLYRDHGGGSTYVRLFGRRTDAHLVGGITLVVALAVIIAAVQTLRRSRLHLADRFVKRS